jgi:hypothetical protein
MYGFIITTTATRRRMMMIPTRESWKKGEPSVKDFLFFSSLLSHDHHAMNSLQQEHMQTGVHITCYYLSFHLHTKTHTYGTAKKEKETSRAIHF